MNVDIDWVVRARAQMHSMRCMPGCFLAAAPSSAEELQRPAAPSEDNFASGVGVTGSGGTGDRTMAAGYCSRGPESATAWSPVSGPWLAGGRAGFGTPCT